jgi:putative heme-binding domain-containing protein
MLSVVAGQVAAHPTPQGLQLVRRLAEQVAAQARSEDLPEVERTLAAAETAAPAVAKSIVMGLAKRGGRSSAVGKQPPLWSGAMATILDRLLTTALKTADDNSRSLTERTDAVRTLALGKYTDVGPLLATLIEEKQSQGIQLAAIETLGEFSDPKVAELLIHAWPELTPKLREAAANALLSHPDWTLTLFDAVDKKQIAASELDRERLAMLDRHPNKTVKARSRELLKQLQIGKRDDVVESYRAAMKDLAGDAERGREVFKQNCSACHKLEGVGHEVGPPLAAFKNRGADAVVLNVLDPNREVLPQYQQWMFVDDDGVQHVGLIKAEGEGSITLLRGENALETILRSGVESQLNTGRSLMPEGLEKQVDPQKMADLVAYIMSQK